MRDVGVKRGIVEEKTRNFWFEQQFLKRICVIFRLNQGFSKRKSHFFSLRIPDFQFKSGILKEKKCDFCLSGVFWKGKCVIFGKNGGFSKRKCFVSG